MPVRGSDHLGLREEDRVHGQDLTAHVREALCQTAEDSHLPLGGGIEHASDTGGRGPIAVRLTGEPTREALHASEGLCLLVLHPQHLQSRVGELRIDVLDHRLVERRSEVVLVVVSVLELPAVDWV